jgi:trimeric autotransporter adhesin
MKKIIILIVMLNAEMNLSAQNIGIGTTSPEFKLDVKNGSINTDSVYRIGGFTITSIKGIDNLFIGHDAGVNNTGNSNLAAGYRALGSYSANLPGSSNVALGAYAHLNNLTGNRNTAVGSFALANTTSSEYNTAVGYHAGIANNHGYNNVFVGANTNTNGEGYFNVIAIGQGTIVAGSSRAFFGNPATNQYAGWAGWSTFSDGRFKTNVNENVPGLSFISKLRPVTYNIKATALNDFLQRGAATGFTSEANPVYAKALIEKEALTYTGFIAQEVEEAARKTGFDFSGVHTPSNEKDNYALSYAEFVVPLVKAVQEQQQQIEELRNINTKQKVIIESLLQRLEKIELKLAFQNIKIN